MALLTHLRNSRTELRVDHTDSSAFTRYLLLGKRNIVEEDPVIGVGVAPDADCALAVGHVDISDLKQLPGV